MIVYVNFFHIEQEKCNHIIHISEYF